MAGTADPAEPAPQPSAADRLPLLPTTVVGSYPVPDWLERLKTDYHRNRISLRHLDEVHDVAIKAAVKDQERIGLDLISDGELRRDNDVDYLLPRIPGIRLSDEAKQRFYFDYYDAEIDEPLGPPTTSLGLVEELRFVQGQTDQPVKFSFTGPISLARRLRNHAYPDDSGLVRALAELLNAEARELAAAGARYLQIDEPFLAGSPELVDLAVEAVTIVTKDVPATWLLHVCWGNRYARPLWQGHYDFLFPAILSAPIDQLVLEFARTGYDDLSLLEKFSPGFALGLGVIDVKGQTVETPETVAARIRRGLAVLPPEQLMINPDCGLRHLPPAVALAKLRAMVAGTALVRAQLDESEEEPG